MSTKICGIYCIENIVNDKKYIGQSVDIIHRFYEHKSDLNANKHYNTHLQNAWNKYGKDNFIFYVIEECVLNMLDEREKYYIKLFGSNMLEFGYNKNSGGKGITHELIEKLSCAATKNIWTNERKKQLSEKMAGENNPMYGKKHTEEAMTKIIASRFDMSGENNPMYGKHHSEETKNKISQAKKGQIPSQKTIESNKARTGLKHPRHKAIYCQELDRTFWGSTQVEQEGITKQSYVSAVLSGKQKTAGKHPDTGEPLHWIYANEQNCNVVI